MALACSAVENHPRTAAPVVPSSVSASATEASRGSPAAQTAGGVDTSPSPTQERFEVVWWQEWDNRRATFCPGLVVSLPVAPVPGPSHSGCWAASFDGRVSVGGRWLEATTGHTAALVVCERQDGSLAWSDQWVSSADSSPGLYGLAADTKGRLLVLQDDAVPARIRVYDSRGAIERGFRYGAPTDEVKLVRSALLTRDTVLLSVDDQLISLEQGQEAWRAELSGALGGARVKLASDGSSYAVYATRDAPEYPTVISKSSPSGRRLWQKTLGQVDVADVAVGQHDSLIVAGRYLRPWQFGTQRLRPRHEQALFVAAYTADGQTCWLRTADATDAVKPLSVAVDHHGRVSVLVWFRGELDLAPNHPEATHGGLAAIRLDQHGATTMTHYLGASKWGYSRLAVDSRGDLLLQLVGLDATDPLAPATRQAYEPERPRTSPHRPTRCALARARIVVESPATHSGR